MRAAKMDAVCPPLFYTITFDIHTHTHDHTAEHHSEWAIHDSTVICPETNRTFILATKYRENLVRSHVAGSGMLWQKNCRKKTNRRDCIVPEKNLQRKRHWIRPIHLATVLTNSHMVIHQKRKILEKKHYYSEPLNTWWCWLLSVRRMLIHRHSRIFESSHTDIKDKLEIHQLCSHTLSWTSFQMAIYQ